MRPRQEGKNFYVFILPDSGRGGFYRIHVKREIPGENSCANTPQGVKVLS
jgi:hypothetical protein